VLRSLLLLLLLLVQALVPARQAEGSCTSELLLSCGVLGTRTPQSHHHLLLLQQLQRRCSAQASAQECGDQQALSAVLHSQRLQTSANHQAATGRSW
jgi:hypothetical protein